MIKNSNGISGIQQITFSNEDSEIETKIKLIQLFLSNYEEYRSVQLDRIYKKMSKISEETKEIKDEQAAMSDF